MNKQIQNYFDRNGINQQSEKLFVEEFIIPIIGIEKLCYLKAQEPFIDQSGKQRRIDFAFHDEGLDKIAFEIDGESYHAEGAITSKEFDDSLFRQNELVNNNWHVLRFSYTQLQDPIKREYVFETIKCAIQKHRPDLLPPDIINPNGIQQKVLAAIDYHRSIGKNKGIIVMPTGTGKTYLSAMDMKKFLAEKPTNSRGLFVVHNLEILNQAKKAYEKVFNPDTSFGKLDGKIKDNIKSSKILFASKDSLVNQVTLSEFNSKEFDYIVIDEVHHSQAKSYKKIFEFFQPNFMLGMTATPDRNDRKDIMELFDYQKISEFTFHDAIDEGFLVNIEYHGLTDDVDYSKIRFKGNKYDVQDLDRFLNIQKRNEAILDQYKKYITGDKTIGFCVTIDHANRMAKLFNESGIKAISINSNNSNSSQLIEKFRNNEYNVAFTVDMFNEGVDVPNVRGLLFLRPTESKTIFTQQLGRGLRLANGKEKIIVLDFIGNYHKANNIRNWLSKNAKKTKENGQFNGKVFYEYGENIKVNFDDKVEKILNHQDLDDSSYTKEDLKAEYFAIKEKLHGKRVSKNDWVNESLIPISFINRKFNSWHQFIRELNELTESSYHYPQGTSLGHIMYILYHLSIGNRANTLIDYDYIKMSGGLSSEKRISTIQRQTKYKLQALMELGILEDARLTKSNNLILTKQGKELVKVFNPLLKVININTQSEKSWKMEEDDSYFNKKIADFISKSNHAKSIWMNILMNFDAFEQLLHVIYREHQSSLITKNELYNTFFNSSYVQNFIEANGIEVPSEEGRKRRIPFLNNLAESAGILKLSRSEIKIEKFVIYKKLFIIDGQESLDKLNERKYLARTPQSSYNSIEMESLKELFGSNFGTDNFIFSSDNVIIIEEDNNEKK
ncbi:DEAD/DEAH box helicase family protein [Staphylococcus hominis]|uniref:DEAD/DEAH box helicase family protein n=1 Tax=Staphylococcus hominis TaxID=1290 RepID=UPI001F3AD305|nr:DEAD/DEAH box helicase family protein [Staphylococcus hominis]MCE4990692.1 DEAD/DEAH box helicase family protein [Staphylococcus hominis]